MQVLVAAGQPLDHAALDDYLRTRASQHARDGIATTHVLTDDAAPASILGYCTLSAAQLLLHELAEADRARLPTHPVPAMRMGRLAVAAASLLPLAFLLLSLQILNC